MVSAQRPTAPPADAAPPQTAAGAAASAAVASGGRMAAAAAAADPSSAAPAAAAAAQQQQQERAAAAARQSVLSLIRAGEYYGNETLHAHVGLGACSVLCTEKRVLHVRNGTWELSWQAEWPRLKGVELFPDRERVVLQLFTSFAGSPRGPQQRAIECGNRAAMLLVYRTVQAMRAQYNEALVKGQLSGGAVK